MTVHRVTSNGLRIHDSIRGPDGDAQRVLVLGHTTLDQQAGYANDYEHLTIAEVEELRRFLGEFLDQFGHERHRAFPRATHTDGDRAVYGPWEAQKRGS